MGDSNFYAPGWPGIPPRWTSSAKTGIGTALNRSSRVWFTLSHGIVNEIYYPRVDMACTRELGMIVTDGTSFFSEEKRHCRFEVTPVEPGVPAYRLINTELDEQYRIEKEVFADPHRNVVLQKVRFVDLRPAGETGAAARRDYRLHALLAPHLGNGKANNTGWTGDYKGVPMLFASSPDGFALALACSGPWKKMSAGFAGHSDGWHDLSRNFQMTQEYSRAENGNVALTGEIDLRACGGEFVLALGFGGIWAEAAEQVRAALLDNYSALFRDYVSQWKGWQKTLMPLDGTGEADLYRASTAMLRAHGVERFSRRSNCQLLHSMGL